MNAVDIVSCNNEFTSWFERTRVRNSADDKSILDGAVEAILDKESYFVLIYIVASVVTT